jgi:hypothetical protein
MIEGIRALLARILRDSAARLEPIPRPPVTPGTKKPGERPSWETVPKRHVIAPAIPGDRSLPGREMGPYEEALSMPDIMTYIDKESFDRMAKRAREGWEKTRDEE